MFEPASSKRRFRLVTSDYLVSLLFAHVIQNIHQQGPHITFEIISPGASGAELLLRGEVNMMIVPERYRIDGHPAQLLFEEEHVCVVWRDNPEVGERLPLEQYMQMGHISVGFGRNRHLSI